MNRPLSAKMFCLVLAGALLTAAASIWASATASPPVAWLVAAGLSILAAASALALSRGQLGTMAGRMLAYAGRLQAGDLDAQVEGGLPGEMGALVPAFAAATTELRKSQDFAKGLLASLSESYPYLSLDATGRITQLSSTLVSLLDLPGKDVDYLGKTPGEVFFNDANRSTTSLEALRQNKRIERETTLTTVKGNKRVLKVSANPIADATGKVMGSLTIYFDLTRIKENEQALANQASNTEALARETLGIATEVNAASEQLAELITGANNDAKRLLEYAGESATAMEQMNATVLEVARNSTDAASMAKGASDKATEGSQTLEGLVSRIAAVDAVIGELKNRVNRLDTQADDIGKIIYVINDIADQTNLLALNAAIEAARAGDAGRGFAVVADEVRKLAEKTMSATGEVGAVISGIQTSVKSAASEMEDVSKAIGDVTGRANDSGAALANILGLAGQTSGQVHAIAVAAEEQSAAVSQINRTVEETNNIAGHTTSSMNTAALSVLSLSGRASDLQRMIEGITAEGSLRSLDGLMADGKKQDCWEFKRCGREKGGPKVAEMGVCPAWPDHGRDCAIVKGTFCGGKVQGDYASKIAHCAKCDYFKSEHHLRDLDVTNQNQSDEAPARKGKAPAEAARKPLARPAARTPLRQ